MDMYDFNVLVVDYFANRSFKIQINLSYCKLISDKYEIGAQTYSIIISGTM